MRYLILILLSMTLMACGVKPAVRNVVPTAIQVKAVEQKVNVVQHDVSDLKVTIADALLKTPADAPSHDALVTAVIQVDTVARGVSDIGTALVIVEKAATQDANVIKSQAKTIANQNDPVKKSIEHWSEAAILLGIVCLVASFVFVSYLGALVGWIRDAGILLVVVGLFGTVFAIILTALEWVIIILLAAASITAMALAIWKVIQYKKAGLSLIDGVQQLFDKNLLNKTPQVTKILDTSQTTVAKQLVDTYQAKQ